MNRPLLIFYGAFDRFNYGDLVLPILLEKLLKDCGINQYEYRFAGIRASDLSRYGARRTEPINRFVWSQRMPYGSAILIVGGEVLGGTWADMSRFLWPRQMNRLVSRMKWLFGESLWNKLVKFWYRSRWDFAYAIRKEAFSCPSLKVLYHAVGGSNLKSRPEDYSAKTRECLEAAAYVSARDKITQEILNHSKPLAGLVPDTVVLMSDVFPPEELSARMSKKVEAIIRNSASGYLCFQVRRSIAEPHIHEIARQLDNLYKKTGMDVVLLPLGTVAGHEDPYVLSEIMEQMNTPAIFAQTESVYDIMALLANAKIYMGSSLHGTITAMSYAVPYVCFARVPKLKAFLETWSRAELTQIVEPVDFTEAIEKAMAFNKLDLINQKEMLSKEAWKGIDAIASVLNEASSFEKWG